MTDKRVKWNSEFINSLSTDDALYLLTPQQANALQSTIPQMMWPTRWTAQDRPSNDELGAFASDISNRLMNPMDICSFIADCINNDPSVRAAIEEIINEGNSLPNNNGDTNIGRGDDNIMAGVSCDLDSVYGVAVAVQDYIAALAVNFLNYIADADTLAARLASIIDFVPILGDLPVLDDLNEMVNVIGQEGLTSFNVAYTEQVKEDLYCDLFQKACGDCELTGADILNVYSTGGSLGLNASSAFYLITTAIAGVTTNTAFMYGILALTVSTLMASGSFGGSVGMKLLNQRALASDPDSDWQIFCDPCQTTNVVPTFIAPCFGGGVAGQNLTSTGVNRWRAETTLRAGVPDEAVMIGSVNDVPFLIDNIVLSTPNFAAGYQQADLSCLIGQPPTGQSLLQFGYTWQNGTPTQAIEFDMTPAP